MAERLYFDRADVYVLADCDPRAGGRVRLVVCEHPDGAAYAAQLADLLGIAVQHGPQPEPGLRSEPRPAPPPGRREPEPTS